MTVSYFELCNRISVLLFLKVMIKTWLSTYDFWSIPKLWLLCGSLDLKTQCTWSFSITIYRFSFSCGNAYKVAENRLFYL